MPHARLEERRESNKGSSSGASSRRRFVGGIETDSSISELSPVPSSFDDISQQKKKKTAMKTATKTKTKNDDILVRLYPCPHACGVKDFTRKEGLKKHLGNFHPSSEYLVDFNEKFAPTATLLKQLAAIANVDDMTNGATVIERQAARIRELKKDLRLADRKASQHETACEKQASHHKTETDKAGYRIATLSSIIKKYKNEIHKLQQVNVRHIGRETVLETSQRRLAAIDKQEYPQQIADLTEDNRMLEAENKYLKLQVHLLNGGPVPDTTEEDEVVPADIADGRDTTMLFEDTTYTIQPTPGARPVESDVPFGYQLPVDVVTGSPSDAPMVLDEKAMVTFPQWIYPGFLD